SCIRVARNVVVSRRLRPVLVSRYSYTPLTKASADPPAMISRLMVKSALRSLTDSKNWLNVACSVDVKPGYTRRISARSRDPSAPRLERTTHRRARLRPQRAHQGILALPGAGWPGRRRRARRFPPPGGRARGGHPRTSGRVRPRSDDGDRGNRVARSLGSRGRARLPRPPGREPPQARGQHRSSNQAPPHSGDPG